MEADRPRRADRPPRRLATPLTVAPLWARALADEMSALKQAIQRDAPPPVLSATPKRPLKLDMWVLRSPFRASEVNMEEHGGMRAAGTSQFRMVIVALPADLGAYTKRSIGV